MTITSDLSIEQKITYTPYLSCEYALMRVLSDGLTLFEFSALNAIYCMRFSPISRVAVGRHGRASQTEHLTIRV